MMDRMHTEPIKFNEYRQQKYLGLLASGMRRGAAARAAGVCRGTVCAYVRNHPGFARRVDDAEAWACDKIEDALYQAAKGGNVMAMRFWLTNRNPERWKNTRNLVHHDEESSAESKALQEILQRLKDHEAEEKAMDSAPDAVQDALAAVGRRGAMEEHTERFGKRFGND